MSTTAKTGVRHVRVAVIGAGLSGVAAGAALEAGRDRRLRDPRARRRRRRRVARQHLPGDRVRHPFAPVLLSPAHPTRSGRARSPAAARSTTTSATSPPSTASTRTLRFGQEVLDASWDDPRQRWSISTTDLQLTADVLIDATGPLTDPQLPDVPGLDSFAGTVFHSARWNHDHDLRGERVAVVGSGASSIQFVPAIQPLVGRLTLLPAHPGLGRPAHRPRTTARSSGACCDASRARCAPQRLVAVPRARRPALPDDPPQPRRPRRCSKASRACHLRRHVKDPQLRAKLTPDLRDRLQAPPDLQRLVPRARAAQRRRRRRRPARGARPHRDRERRLRARGRHDHPRHRLRGRPAADHRADPRPRRSLARRHLAPAAASLPRRRSRRLPQLLPARRRRLRRRARLAALPDRGADRLPARRAAHDEPPAA